MIEDQIEALRSEWNDTLDSLKKKIKVAVCGLKVEIVDDWNGQPYGSSRKSRRGQVCTVDHLSFDGQWCWVNLQEYPYDSSPRLEQVKFL